MSVLACVERDAYRAINHATERSKNADADMIMDAHTCPICFWGGQLSDWTTCKSLETISTNEHMLINITFRDSNWLTNRS